MDPRHPRHKGNEAEDRAARLLLDLGWTIVKRNYRARHGEIDIIALDGETLVMVEVRARARFRPEETVDRAKQERLLDSARQYLIEVGEEDRLVRFDLIAVEAGAVRHTRDAFLYH